MKGKDAHPGFKRAGGGVNRYEERMYGSSWSTAVENQ